MLDASGFRPETTAAADFVLDVLAASASAPFGTLRWPEINRLAHRWLRPSSEGADTTRVGHALVLEMAEQGLIEAEVTVAADGTRMVERVVHPRYFGLEAAHRLAA